MNSFFEQSLITMHYIDQTLKNDCCEYLKNSQDHFCIIPTQLTNTHVLIVKEFDKNKRPKEQYAQLAIQMSALINWQYTKSIYRFDETLFLALVNQKLDIIPMQLLYQLPESSFFIETYPVNKYLGKGFFVHYDHTDNGYSLRLTFWELSRNMSCLDVPLSTTESISQMIQKILSTYPKVITIADRSYFEKRLRMALNLILYLCAENTDYSGRKKPQKPFTYKILKSTHYHKIGASAGRLLKKHNNVFMKRNLHGKIQPHIRSAHWHTYWTGKGKTIPKLKWIAPIFVNKDQS